MQITANHAFESGRAKKRHTAQRERWVSNDNPVKPSRFMKTLFYLAAMSLLRCLLPLQFSVAEAATPRDTADYPADPRPVVVEFFQHVRAGDAESAWKCWDPAVGKGQDKQYEVTQIRNTIAYWIAQFRLEQVLEEKLPQLYDEMKSDGTLIPTPEQITKARFTTFRRLAIVRWGDDEDAALPLELDTSAKPPRWLISLRHYRETTRASVGDTFRVTDIVARATDNVTKDVLDGKVKTAEDLAEAQMRHLGEQLERLQKPQK
jgi:hypothetical protein